jgi:hypothetical protein
MRMRWKVVQRVGEYRRLRRLLPNRESNRSADKGKER